MKLTPALLPGVVLSLAAAALSYGLSAAIPNFSAMIAAIILGALCTNLLPLSPRLRPGIEFAAKILLRVGIVLLGLKLAVKDIISLGWPVLIVVLLVVSVGIVATLGIGKLMGLSSHLRTLIACGFSICGAAAVAGVAGTIDPDDEREAETVTAVALVVIYGTAMIALIPLLIPVLGLDPQVGALWAGASTHEIAQVVAIGGILGGNALSIAVVVKLARVLLLAPVIAIIAVQHRRAQRLSAENVGAGLGAGAGAGVGAGLGAGAGAGAVRLPPVVPLFVVGFVAMVVLRSLVAVPAPVLQVADVTQTILLAAAMFALGCGVRLQNLRQVGYRPFLVAGAATLVVAVIGLVGMLLAGTYYDHHL